MALNRELKMLFLLCYLKDKFYAIKGTYVSRILPSISLEKVSSQEGLVGMIPVIGQSPRLIFDLDYLVYREFCQKKMYSRILFLDRDGYPPLGLLVSHMTDVMNIDEPSIQALPYQVSDREFSDSFFFTHQGHSVYILNIDKMLVYLKPLLS